MTPAGGSAAGGSAPEASASGACESSVSSRASVVARDEVDLAALPVVLLVGNPNVGKTRLFNRLARRNERVGNYPGVTVERRSAEMALRSGRQVVVADLPGAYSLSARSSEEQIALQAVLGWADN